MSYLSARKVWLKTDFTESRKSTEQSLKIIKNRENRRGSLKTLKNMLISGFWYSTKYKYNSCDFSKLLKYNFFNHGL